MEGYHLEQQGRLHCEVELKMLTIAPARAAPMAELYSWAFLRQGIMGAFSAARAVFSVVAFFLCAVQV